MSFHAAHRITLMVIALVLPVALLLAPGSAVALGSDGAVVADASRGGEARAGWRWPVDAVRVTRPYQAPAHRYGPGHRGVDLAAAPGEQVRAPAAGIVAFAGTVVDRGVITIDHGDGYVTTLEPVTDAPPVGTAVAAGDPVGVVTTGGHTAPGSVHFGVREHGEYINPMLLLGGIPRAILLPCC